jgi:alpha-L-fucosidase
MTAEERLAWWQEARFGMFIHWGLYAELAGEWKGKRVPGIGEWIMRNGKIPIGEYEALAKDFNPVKFDAEAWAELARRAGMKYLVITAKHHEGFCMFDSPSNPYNIVKQTPFGRDPMKELAAACNKRGIRLCFYYSQALDWHAPGGAGHWDETGTGPEWLSYARPPEDFQNYLDAVVKPNLVELLTQYGSVGLIWFDTPVAITPEQSRSLRDLVHSIQPTCLVSGRVGHDVGDYGSLGDNEHPAGKVQGAWETPATLNDTWGYRKDDHNWKSLATVLELLVNCASKGVNYLLNVGPTAEGVIPQPSVDLLKQVGDWMERNGEAIHGTSASPFFTDPSWGRVTCRGEILYLMVKQWPTDGVLALYGLRNKVRSARIPGRPDEKVCFTQTGDTVLLNVPATAPEEIVSVVAVTVAGAPDVEQLVIQEGAAPIHLSVVAGQPRGKITVRQDGVIEGWHDLDNSISWTFRLKTPGEYDVVAVTRAHPHHPEWFGNHDVRVTHKAISLGATIGVRDMGKVENEWRAQLVRSRVGSLRIEAAGEQDITLVAERLDGSAIRGLKLVSLELVRKTG